jgi:hypothetical protein
MLDPFGPRENFFTWRDGVNTIQIVIILGAYFLGDSISSGWGIFLKLIALVVLINLFRTISWWLKRY